MPLRGAPPRNRGYKILQSAPSRRSSLPYQGVSRIQQALRRVWPDMGNGKQPRISSYSLSIKTRELFGCQRSARTSFYLSPTPPTRHLMSVELLERLIGKLRSMYLEVSGAIWHLYAMQVAHNCAANCATTYLSARLHLGVNFWRYICKAMDTCPT